MVPHAAVEVGVGRLDSDPASPEVWRESGNERVLHVFAALRPRPKVALLLIYPIVVSRNAARSGTGQTRS